MTASDIIQTARVRVGDDRGESSLWPDQRFATVIQDGLRYLWRMCPEVRLDEEGGLNDMVEFGNNYSLDLGLDEQYYEPMVSYVAAAFFSTASEDNQSRARTQEHWNRFLMLIGLPPGVRE